MNDLRESIDISTSQWYELLKDNHIFKAEDIALINALYNCHDYRGAASELADILGVVRHSVLNLQVGRLGKRIIQRLPNVKYPLRKNGDVRYWHILFWGEDAEVKGKYYWQLRPELKDAFQKLMNEGNLKIKYEENTDIPQEIPEEMGMNLPEGAIKRITVNAYERNRKARQLCLKKYGFKCYVCGFDFEAFYGKIGKNFIEVHHIKPLSELNKEYIVDPVNDLIPVCPNCHSMLHRANITVEELRNIVEKKQK